MGSTRHAVINQRLNSRQVNGEKRKNECEKREGGTKEMGRDIEERDGEPQRGMQWECGEVSLSKPHSCPAKPLSFFPSLFSG